MSGSIKFLLFLIVAGVVALGCLWFVGGKKREYTTTLTIDAPPDQVFPWLTDEMRVPKWAGGVRSVQMLGEGELGTGSHRVVSVERDGEVVSFDEEVIRYEPNELLSVRSIDDRFVLLTVIQLEPLDGDRTEMSYKIKITARGVSRVFAPFADDDELREKAETDTLTLKRAVEQVAASNVRVDGAANETGSEAGGDE